MREVSAGCATSAPAARCRHCATAAAAAAARIRCHRSTHLTTSKLDLREGTAILNRWALTELVLVNSCRATRLPALVWSILLLLATAFSLHIFWMVVVVKQTGGVCGVNNSEITDCFAAAN